MKIRILGLEDQAYRQLRENIRTALDVALLDEEVEEVTGAAALAECTALPALELDGHIALAGAVLSAKEIYLQFLEPLENAGCSHDCAVCSCHCGARKE